MSAVASRVLGSFVRPRPIFLPLERIASLIGGGFILAFHEIPGDQFTEQIEAYRGLKIVSLAEMVDRIRTNSSTGCLAITVDDGIGSTVRSLSAVCLDRKWPITFYLPTSYLDNPASAVHMLWTNIGRRLPIGTFQPLPGGDTLSDEAHRARFIQGMLRKIYTQPICKYEQEVCDIRDRLVQAGVASAAELAPPPPITWDEVSNLSKNELLDFQSHGVSHEAVSAMNVADLETELKSSGSRIAEATGRPCRHFCYPFGGQASIGSAAPKLASEFYDSAVTMDRGRVKGKDLMLLPRIPIYTKDSVSLARLKVLTI